MPRYSRWLVALTAAAGTLAATPAFAAVPVAAHATVIPTVSVSSTDLTVGDTVSFSGTGYLPGEEVYVRLIPAAPISVRRGPEPTSRLTLDEDNTDNDRRIVVLGIFLAGADGSVSGDVWIPDYPGIDRVRPGDYHFQLAGHASQLWQSVRVSIAAGEGSSGHKPPQHEPPNHERPDQEPADQEPADHERPDHERPDQEPPNHEPPHKPSPKPKPGHKPQG
ncbi:hypothetical protein ADK52_38265 [Streptomyces sp. WM6372]|uniref:hypothetical protein n=1 Tax=Streptomyces sp. WM6372 TaxID=1415555 RepID=UPI0006AFF0F1|nr:hypothetical protein [Streptomyces sp. WM6372]KOU13806.1 hypothetical protein ADK52_38265 [Streptomyces sp. WM6372]